MTDHLQMKRTPVEIGLADYQMRGGPVVSQIRKMKDLQGIFHDEKAFRKMPPEQVAYTVQSWLPVPEGTSGGLYFGTTNLMPGKIGDEYMITKGHFHSRSDRAEFYWGIQGQGMLLLMDRERHTWTEEMYPGSLHYIPAHVAHRVANTGSSVLIFGACWPSDAGHDYKEIAANGFSARLVEKEGNPLLVSNEKINK